MERIESFKINHLNLDPGLYVSRKDIFGDAYATTFDLRFTKPNFEPVMDNPGLHTIEHLGATFLRNSEMKEKIIYFGPMGCRTGFYLIIGEDSSPEKIYPLILEMLDFIISFEGEIPGASPEQCGNYLDQNLRMAKFYAKKYRNELSFKRFNYPEQ